MIAQSLVHSLTRSLDAVASIGPVLLTGTTVVLGLGCLAVRLHRAPIHWQRIGELTMAAAFLWTLLALVPLPRPLVVSELLPIFVRNTDSLLVPIADSRRSVALPPKTGAGTVSDVARDAAVKPVELQPIRPANPRSRTLFLTIPTNEMRRGGQQALSPSVRLTEIAPKQQPPARVISAVTQTKGAARASEIKSDVQSSTFTRDRTEPQLVDSLRTATGPAAGRWSFLSRLAAILVSGWPRLLAILYLVGSALCLAWLGFGSWLLRRVVRTSRPPEEWLRTTFASLTGPGRTSRARLLISDRYPRALSYGLFKPTIVLPALQCRPEKLDRLRHVLLHELAHIRQRDAWGHQLFNVAFVPFYFHPCYWWLRSRVRMASELIADEWAAAQSTPEQYARELIGFARACRGRGLRPASAMGILDSTSQFSRRIEMLIRRERPLAIASSRVWRLASLAVCAVVVSAVAAGVGTPLRADSKDDKPSAERLKQVERERDEFQKRVATLEAELKQLRETRQNQPQERAGAVLAPIRIREEQTQASGTPPRAVITLKKIAPSVVKHRLQILDAEKGKSDSSIRSRIRFATDIAANALIIEEASPRDLRWITALIKQWDQPIPPMSYAGHEPVYGPPTLSVDNSAISFTDGSAPDQSQNELHVFKLKTFDVSSLEDIMKRLFPQDHLRMVVNTQTNELVVAGASADQLRRIEEAVKIFDHPPDGESSSIPEAGAKPTYETQQPRASSRRQAQMNGSRVKEKSTGVPIRGVPFAGPGPLGAQAKPNDDFSPKHDEAPKQNDMTAQAEKAKPRSVDGPPPHRRLGDAIELHPDISTLAIAFTDALSEYEALTVKVPRLKKLFEQHSVSEQVFDDANTRLRAAERKVRLLRGIARTARDVAARKANEAKARNAAGQAPQSTVDEAVATFEMLNLILFEDPVTAK